METNTVPFDQAEGFGADDLSGKGYSLVQMTRLGFPVPSGFVIKTELSRRFNRDRTVPDHFDSDLRLAVKALEQRTGKRFGDRSNPLLLSVRSGAKISMPGMMDTVLNIGLNRDIVSGLAERTNNRIFAMDLYRRLLESFGTTVLGCSKARYNREWKFAKDHTTTKTELEFLQSICDLYETLPVSLKGRMFPQEPEEQLDSAIKAVWRSWYCDRAVSYRQTQKIPDDLGTAVIIQEMVYGNADNQSGTGVAFSRDINGNIGLSGEYLPDAQGEDLVSGTCTPRPLSELKLQQPAVFRQLEEIVEYLDRWVYNDMVDVEFTVERGKLYLLQSRVAKRTPIAAAHIAVDMVNTGRWSKDHAVSQVDSTSLLMRPRLRIDQVDLVWMMTHNLQRIMQGIPASAGAVTGLVVFDTTKAMEYARNGHDVILFRPDTTPDDFEAMLLAKAVVTGVGGQTCHAAVVARGLGKPAVVGVPNLTFDPFGDSVTNGSITYKSTQVATVDGGLGIIVPESVKLIGAEPDPVLDVFLSWVKPFEGFEVNPRLVFNRYCANTMLNDFYISGALENAAPKALFQDASRLHAAIRTEIATVFSTYLLIAVGGELRHSWRCDPVEVCQIRAHKAMQAELARFGVPRGESRLDAQQKVMEYLLSQSLSKTEEFLKLAVDIFGIPGWPSAYGGESWEKIASTLLLRLRGEINDELYVDRVFDLRHNSKRLFDKHEMFTKNTRHDVLNLQLGVKKAARSLSHLKENLLMLHKDVSPSVMKIYRKVRKEN